jgi:ribosomal protein L12E/L44/L45/RPP1/RPP2
MRTFAIAAIITSLAVPAVTSLAAPAFAAEDPSKASEYRYEEQKKKDAEEIEKAYKDMLKRTNREQPVKKADPWGNMR